MNQTPRKHLHKNNKAIALLAAASLLLSFSPALAKAAPDAPQVEAVKPDAARMKWFQDARMGMFIHWGPYSITGCEWQGKTGKRDAHMMQEFRIPLADYKKLAANFNPVRFDAAAWVKLAKDAGLGYIVYVSKHHDGFAMYNSPSSDYDMVDATTFARDPLKDLAAECRKQGLVLCVYYSLGRDWSVPGVPAGGRRRNDWDFPNPPATSQQDYIDHKVKPQLRELLTQYGPLGAIWFDTPEKTTREQSKDLRAFILSLQPNCLINARIGNGQGDFDIHEQKIPAAAINRPWESCLTINDRWGFDKNNHNWKSPEMIVRCLVDVVSKGGNFLINVGPTGEGVIPAPSAERLLAIGDWLKVNGESIHGTTASPIAGQNSGVVFQEINADGNETKLNPHGAADTHDASLPRGWRATRKPGVLYIHLFDRPADGVFKLPAMPETIQSATLLADPEHRSLAISRERDGVSVTLPADVWDKRATVIKLVVSSGQSSAIAQASLSKPAPLILDMVHHNPGEPRYESRYENPSVIKQMGFNGKVYFLFDSPTLAINWESVDPEIFPKGSPGRAWVDAKAAQIDGQFASCKAAGIKTYAMADLVLFPKALVKKYKMEKTFGDPRDPQTDKFLRAMIRQIFECFPDLNGLVVRIGETYLQDAPFHQGHILDKTSAEKTIVPLMNLLREEICVRRNKQLVFRSWLSFDTNLKTYLAVSDAVEPHTNLVFGVKHCEGDFHRGNAFSKVLGQGRHPQLIEVQCAREYEGKGAFPNYIANGVIEGFEEHRLAMPTNALKSIRGLAENRPELFAGIWTWTRGGGWFGPFIKNELWCDLNAWVMAQWAKDTSQSEESIFNRYATERLHLTGGDAAKFRRLCLLSADAVVRGKNTTRADVSPWWSRDQNINVPKVPPGRAPRILKEKADAVRQWEEIAKLAREINFADAKTKDYVIVSAEYGLRLYRIYQAIFELSAAGDDVEKLRHWLKVYDDAWADYRRIPEFSPQCASLYEEIGTPKGTGGEGIETFIPRLRKIAEAGAKVEPPALPAK